MRKIKNEELNRLSVEDYQKAIKNPIVVVLDNVRSMQNVGSVFRTSDAFLIQKIYLCGITAQPPHRDITRSALGATETVEWVYFEQTIDAISELIQTGYKIFSIEQVDGAQQLQDVVWDGQEKWAIVFGHEVDGVQQEVVNASTGAIEIPQFGSKHSFNVSVSAGIVLWQILSSAFQN